MVMYGYMKQHDLEELIMNNRIAWVVTNIDSRDKQEYINCILITLHNSGFNTNILTRCHLIKSNGCDNIVLLVRKQVKLTEDDIHAMNNWISQVGGESKVMSIQKFINNIYKPCDNHNQCHNITCLINTGNKRKFKATLRIDTNNSGDICSARVISPKFGEMNNKQIYVEDCGKNLPKVVERFYGTIYRKYNYTIEKCYYIIDGKLLKYNVVPTAFGIKLNLI